VSSQIAELAQIHQTEHSEGDPRRWLALPVLLTGAFLPILDFNVVNLALPAIRQDLDATSSEVQFVISAYAATYAVFLITGGRLGDLFGRRRSAGRTPPFAQRRLRDRTRNGLGLLYAFLVLS
jgi:MFS family permease